MPDGTDYLRDHCVHVRVVDCARVNAPFWSGVSVGVRGRDGCRMSWGGLVLGGGASPFRFGGFHVLVQHPICSFILV